MVVLYPHPAPLKPTSTDAVNRGYWDPEESTRNKWTNDTAHGGYADILEERGLTKDFTGLSTLLLGQAQPAQFQSADQTGYWWGSKVKNDGTYELSSNVDYNAFTQQAREYYANQIGYFNYYAATAESNYSGGNASDSICPSGWELPGESTSNTWSNLLVNANLYSLADNEESSKILRSNPLSFTMNGRYYWADGNFGHIGNYGMFRTSVMQNSLMAARILLFTQSSIEFYNDSSSLTGFPVRCVKK